MKSQMSAETRLLLLMASVGIVVALFPSCSSTEATNQPSAQELFERAMAKFNDEEYQEAYDDFRIVTLQFQGSNLTDDAHYHMGECKYRREEYLLAAFEYDVLIRTLPTSEFVSDARFKKAMCYYEYSPRSFLDQEYTVRAIDEFQTFLEYHPTDPRVPEAEVKINEMNTKLAKKEYDNGAIYMKMDYFRAATIAFNHVLEKYHDTPYAEPALLGKARSLYERKRYLDARIAIALFLDKYPSSTSRGEAESLRLDILSEIGDSEKKSQQAVADSTKSL